LAVTSWVDLAAFVGTIVAEDPEERTVVERQRKTNGFSVYDANAMLQELVQVNRSAGPSLAIMRMRLPCLIDMLDASLDSDLTAPREPKLKRIWV
jgi:CheY-like chemotaxis protein